MGKNFKNFFATQFQLSDGMDNSGIKRVQLLRTGTFKHPAAPNGSFSITPEMLIRMKANFDNNVRRLDKAEIPVDYGHNTEGKAAGWIEKIELDDAVTSLWVDINYTQEAEEAILQREWRFISADIDFEYKDNETDMNMGATLLGAGLVNRPHVKEMKAIFADHNNNEDKPNKEFSMSPEEMMKKIGELQAALDMLKQQLQMKDEKLKDAAVAEDKVVEEKVEVEKQLAEAKTEILKLTEEKQDAQKEAKFSEYLKDGKVIVAQKDAFMKMSLELSESLFKDAKVLNLKDHGHGAGDGKETGTDGGTKTAYDIIEERAAKLRELDKSLTLGDSYSQVMSQDPELNQRYQAESSSVKM